VSTKVFVTGLGVVSSLGNHKDDVFRALLENRSGVRAYPDWKQYTGLRSWVGAPAAPYDVSVLPRSARRTMSRMSEMAAVATLDALRQADLKVGSFELTPRIGICIGSTMGSPEAMETYFRKLFERGGPEGQMGTSFFKIMNHSVQANVAAALGFRGPAVSPSSACSTSAEAMVLGWELLQTGLYDAIIAGGADELHYIDAAIFDVVQAASCGYNDRPDETPRPFDRDRDGLVTSEGAGVVILESEEGARKRGVKRIAEMCGGAYLCDGSHMSQSSPSTMYEVMRLALERGNVSPDDVDYVNAHATATIQGDQAEAEAIGRMFGDRVAVSSLKGHFGHTLAASGTLEAIAGISMMEAGRLIPTRNLRNVDPACKGIQHVQNSETRPVRVVMKNNFAFGGMTASLLLSRCGEGK
jgi:3-oxoacyl-[acyl-carrier-protein] synthase II